MNWTDPDRKQNCIVRQAVCGRKDGCCYSNIINLWDEKGDFLLIQYSDLYDGWARVNTMRRILRVERR